MIEEQAKEQDTITATLDVFIKDGLDDCLYKQYIDYHFDPIFEVIESKTKECSMFIEDNEKLREELRWNRFIHYCRTGRFPDD